MSNDSVAYRQGRKAFDKGLENSKNPYGSAFEKRSAGTGSMSLERVDWYNGWFDEWRWQKWGPNTDETYVPVEALN